MKDHFVIALLLMFFVSLPAKAADCDPEPPQTKAAIEHTTKLLASGKDKAAIKAAEQAVTHSPDCVSTHLTLAGALQARLEHVGGLKALNLSKKYRKSIRSALALAPNHLGARAEEISYLIHAPGIAGGNLDKARVRIHDLVDLDPGLAAKMALELARAKGETGEIISALQGLTRYEPDNFDQRIELARRLVLAERFHEADKEVSTWEEWPDDEELVLEGLYLKGVLRVRGNFELDVAESAFTYYIARQPRETPENRTQLAHALARLGDARKLQGNIEGALIAYRDALSNDSSNERAIDGIVELELAKEG